MQNKLKLNNMIDTMIIFILLLTSATAWDLMNTFGMSNYWIIFIALSLIITAMILYTYRDKLSIKQQLKDKFNLLLLIYMVWTALTYLVNNQGKSTFLYIFKMGFIILVYTWTFSFYMASRDRETIRKLAVEGGSLKKHQGGSFFYKAAAAIFTLGSVHSVIAVYQIITNSNIVFGVKITEWPAYNPASFYGNVNGLGAYLFFSMVSGLYILFNSQDNRNILISFLIMLVNNALYLTIARTSIVISLVFVLFSGILYVVKNRANFKKVINNRVLASLVLSQLLVFSTINHQEILTKLQLGSNQSTEKSGKEQTRKIEDILKQKNKKGVNNRQYIWGAVLKDYKSYLLFGDGLKYNIVKNINVVALVSKRSKGVDRISYHNTLFRYFASNGLIGLLIFLAVFFYVPMKLLYIMFKNRKVDLNTSIILVFFACIFLYMQMEEAYLGEVGFVQLIFALLLGYSNSLLHKLSFRKGTLEKEKLI